MKTTGNSAKTAIVIGSGVGGLATAVRLARKGFLVKVFEANPSFGGKATKIEKDGFFWGFGPSLFTFPELLDELFELCGRQPAKYYKYHRIDPICNYFFSDGTRLSAFADKEKFAKEIADKTGEPASHVLNHLKHIGRIYELTKDIFLFKSVHKLRTYLTLKSLKALFRLPVIGIDINMNKANEKRFKDKRVIQLFNRYATYNGSDPYLAPSTLNVIAHPEYNQGGYFLDGGMPDLSKMDPKQLEALKKQAEAAGLGGGLPKGLPGGLPGMGGGLPGLPGGMKLPGLGGPGGLPGLGKKK